jgi:hypothetical protein
VLRFETSWRRPKKQGYHGGDGCCGGSEEGWEYVHKDLGSLSKGQLEVGWNRREAVTGPVEECGLYLRWWFMVRISSSRGTQNCTSVFSLALESSL